MCVVFLVCFCVSVLVFVGGGVCRWFVCFCVFLVPLFSVFVVCVYVRVLCLWCVAVCFGIFVCVNYKVLEYVCL